MEGYLELDNLRILSPSKYTLYARGRRWTETLLFCANGNMQNLLTSQARPSTAKNVDCVMDRVIGLVRRFNNIDASKVTETADFKKDLSLDSIDRVGLVMEFEQEFSIEIPDEKADKLTCFADVAKYIVSETEQRANS